MRKLEMWEILKRSKNLQVRDVEPTIAPCGYHDWASKRTGVFWQSHKEVGSRISFSPFRRKLLPNFSENTASFLAWEYKVDIPGVIILQITVIPWCWKQIASRTPADTEICYVQVPYMECGEAFALKLLHLLSVYSIICRLFRRNTDYDLSALGTVDTLYCLKNNDKKKKSMPTQYGCIFSPWVVFICG